VSALTTFLTSAGVPFEPEPVDMPLAPRITRVSVTATAITATVSPASGGLAPDEFAISARDPSGQITSCTVAAPPRPETARCTIEALAPGVTYAVSAIAIAGDMPSTPSPERAVTPAGLPAKPRIVATEVDRGGFAGFVVTRISGNGSPIIRKDVRCSAPRKPARTSPIVSRGIALVSGLSRGTTYSCVAVVVNEFGATKSDKVRFRAR
jgi:hypothetical protein